MHGKMEVCARSALLSESFVLMYKPRGPAKPTRLLLSRPRRVRPPAWHVMSGQAGTDCQLARRPSVRLC